MIKSFILKDNFRIKRMKKYSLSSIYGCSGEVYKLLCLETLQNLIKDIEKGKISLSSSLLYGKKEITLEENFVSILDSYVGYVRDTYSIRHNGLVLILEETLKNLYNKCLFEKEDFHRQNEKFIKSFKCMFFANLVNNTRYYAERDTDKEYFGVQKANEFLKDKELTNDDDIFTMEKFYIDSINCSHHNLYNIFIPYKDIDEKQIDFYMNQLNWFYEDYFRNKSLLSD